MYLLRVHLPDVPGSLGRLASAIGAAGGDIEALEIVEKNIDGTAVDDVLLEMAPGRLPDSVVSAINELDGMLVLWISRYAAGGNLFLDLEVVEEMTTAPYEAVDRLIAMLPMTFRADWAARVGQGGEVTMATDAAPLQIPYVDLAHPERLEVDSTDTFFCAAPIAKGEVVVLGRDGGPSFLDSEVARLGHLVSLAGSISAHAVPARDAAGS